MACIPGPTKRFTKLDPEIALCYAVKALNDIINAKGLLLSHLVSGYLPSIVFPRMGSFLVQTEHLRALDLDRIEVSLATS